ncbi:hypothetical protein [Mycobacterium sp. 1164985.4]|uniref:hypothetical protein n=1 Tax=Mycobacterium sp. 1164985.4 TaxID=1834069 RepID=UPI0018D31242|nr:hypothetical protein [Mycobacterium sp. 1164985.4]
MGILWLLIDTRSTVLKGVMDAPLGILLDYAAGVLKASDIRAPHFCIRWRATSGKWPGSAWTSTTSSSRNLGSGTKPYRSVSIYSKLLRMAGVAEKTNHTRVSRLAAATPLVRHVGNFFITI